MFWQGRYYSCPLDDAHLWAALRYAERNPVRAGMVVAPDEWPWSSARAHCQGHDREGLIDMQIWRQRWSVAEWRRYLDAAESAEEVGVLRQCTHTGRPLGAASFVAALEELTSRSLAPQRGGRPRKQALPGQRDLGFVA